MHYINLRESKTAFINVNLMQVAAAIGVLIAGVLSSFCAFSEAENRFGSNGAKQSSSPQVKVVELEPTLYYVEYSDNCTPHYGYNQFQRYRLPEE